MVGASPLPTPGPATVADNDQGYGLVNVLIAPNGRMYTSGGASQGALQLDNTNNVEVLRIARPRQGAWRLRVIGSNVPRGPQRYAYTLSGKLEM